MIAKNNTYPSKSSEINLSATTALLRRTPSVTTTDLFSASKMEDNTYPEKPGVRVSLVDKLDASINRAKGVEQVLKAVLSLGNNVAVGVVSVTTKSGKANYLSLLNNSQGDNGGRAWLLGALWDGETFNLSRSLIEQAVGSDGCAPDVSTLHGEVGLDGDILTVVDTNSLNGTTVFTNNGTDPTKPFISPLEWSQPSDEVEKLVQAEVSARQEKRVSGLGRFSVES